MGNPPVLVINEGQIAAALSLDRTLAMARQSMVAIADGSALASSLGHLEAPQGEFHLKASGLEVAGRLVVAVKIGACFYQRPTSLQLPSIVGTIQLFDGATGQPLAMMESALITKLRTAAGTAVAVDQLARKDANVLAVCGVGEQMIAHVRAILAVRPVKQLRIWTRNFERGKEAVKELTQLFPGLTISAFSTAGEAVSGASIVVCLTPSTESYLSASNIAPGALVAGVGSDAPNKRELGLDLVRGSKLVCDVKDQCARVGELHHALDTGKYTLEHVHAELGDVMIGKRPGRETDDEIIVFDSTGTAVQDTAVAAAIYLDIVKEGKGQLVDLWAA